MPKIKATVTNFEKKCCKVKNNRWQRDAVYLVSDHRQEQDTGQGFLQPSSWSPVSSECSLSDRTGQLCGNYILKKSSKY